MVPFWPAVSVAGQAEDMRNLITDVGGVLVGQAEDMALGSGVTAILFEEPAVASADVRGGAPGTRDTDLLQPERTVDRIDAVVLSGGSAFGLDAAAGGMAFLAQAGGGFPARTARPSVRASGALLCLLNS